VAHYNIGKNNPNYGKFKPKKKRFCLDCNAPISKMAKRCNVCAQKVRVHKIDCKCLVCVLKRQDEHKEDCPCCVCRSKRGEYIGKQNPRYKGGITPLYKLIKGLDEYRNWRDSVYKRDSYTCKDCGDNRGHNLEAHHLKPFIQILEEFLKCYYQFSPIEDKETLTRLAITYIPFWDVNNGQTLCNKCHKKTYAKT